MKATHQQKRCKDCGITKVLELFPNHNGMKDGHINTCKKCKNSYQRQQHEFHPERHKLYLRQWYKDNTEKVIAYHKKWEGDNPLKVKARNAVAQEVRMGRLQKQPCEVCGECEVEAHHDNYNKPLDVRWLCIKHHRRLHRENSTLSKEIETSDS